MSAALTRYRVLAYATGVFLILLTLHVVLQVVQSGGQDVFEAEGMGALVPGAGTAIPITHGYLYLVYVVVTVDLWFRSRQQDPRRLPFWPTVLVVLAGTVPFASFAAERWVRSRLAGAVPVP